MIYNLFTTLTADHGVVNIYLLPIYDPSSVQHYLFTTHLLRLS